MYYEELTKHLKVRKNLEFQETSNSTNIVDENFGKKSDVFFLLWLMKILLTLGFWILNVPFTYL